MTAQIALFQAQEPHLRIAGQACPVCEQLIPNEKADEVRARLEARDKSLFATERNRIAKEHSDALAKLADETAQKIVSARAEEKKAVERYEALKADQETVIGHRVQELRGALEADHRDKLNTQAALHAVEAQKLTAKVADLARQLEKKTAEELGEGAEVKLFDALRAEFENDRIERVGKGDPGADIVHTVVHKGRECGIIIYDSKNRTGWRNEYVTKLVQDQTAAKADQAILCVLKFPEKTTQLTMREGVIIINPARAIAIVQIIRRNLIHVHDLRLSKEDRAKKMAALYDFITSERCKHLLGRIDSHAETLLKMQQAEKRSHEENWNKQGFQLRSIQKVRGELENEVDRIVGTEEEVDITS